MKTDDWLKKPIEIVRSKGGVHAVVNPWDGVVRAGVSPWPPPELIQKLYQSRQSRAFDSETLPKVTSELGYYSDLQSLHSEDAVTWSVFGPIIYAAPSVRANYAAELIGRITESRPVPSPAHVWLWKRIPHPETLVSGGPEIDFAIQTDDVLVIGEAKWRSAVGGSQGKERNKDQLQLRVEFCQKFGLRLFPKIKRFVVLLVSNNLGSLSADQLALSSGNVDVAETTWYDVAGLSAHPFRDEVLAHLKWRRSLSQS